MKINKLITTQEAAEYLGVHKDTIRDWENKGHIKAIKTPGGHRRFSLKEIKNIANLDVKPKLSVLERQLLANQYSMLAKLTKNEDERNVLSELVEIYGNGYESFYVDEHIKEKLSIPSKVCNEVYNILEMYQMLSASYNNLSDNDKMTIEKYKITFQGFWPNECRHTNEIDYDYLGLARWINKKYSMNLDVRDSHTLVLHKYREMLKRYKKVIHSDNCDNSSSLSKEELTHITEIAPRSPFNEMK